MCDRFFIVNPVSGSGKSRKLFEELLPQIERSGRSFEWRYTTGKGHARELAEEASRKGCQRVISVGGDGTANEVAGALIGSDTEMGILPFGTGNDFAKAVGLPTDPDAALRAALYGEARPVDAAMANDKPFINVSGTGFDVDVIINTEKFKKRFNGMLPYMLGIFQSLMHLKPVTFEITADGESFTERALLFNACNGTHFAGGMHVAPMASPYDGLLDVCILRAISIPQFLLLLPRYTRGAHTASRHVRYFKAKEIAVRCDSENIINLDGELDSSTPVTFKVLPGAIKLALPEEKGNK